MFLFYPMIYISPYMELFALVWAGPVIFQIEPAFFHDPARSYIVYMADPNDVPDP